MIQAVFFDLDGTLMDTAEDITRAINMALLSQGYEQQIAVAQLKPVISYGTARVLEQLLNLAIDDPKAKDIITETLAIYPTIMNDNSRCFSGIDALLNMLDQRSIPWGVISNKPEPWVRELLAHHDLLNRSKVVYGAETFSKRKPDPMPLTAAAQATQVNPNQCIYVGDCLHDITAAKAANMLSAVATFGYAPNDGSEKSWQADFYLKQPKDLLQAFIPA